MHQTGILQDKDPEHLHQYRVALRRTRVILSQFKGVIPEEVRIRFRDGWAQWGRLSNRLRDLDVYLSRKDYYRSILPDKLQPSLYPFFTMLRQERQKEFTKVTKALQSAEYQSYIEEWQRFLTASTPINEIHSDETIDNFVKRLLRKRSKRIMGLSKSIHKRPSSGQLHRLRLQCKKFRYLIEFFKEFYPKKQITSVIKRLKRLQEKLGEFNDISNQLREIQHQKAILKRRKRLTDSTKKALALLTIHFIKRQEKLLVAILHTQQHFVNSKHFEIFKS